MAASAYFDQIQQLYIAYFGRPADPVGLAYWAANVDAANGSVAQVIAGFSTSTESAVLYAGASTAQKVSSIYLALFNRNPEATGLAYWVAQIDSGTVSQAQAAYLIQSSAGPGDATSVANKLAAAKAFTALIDTNAEVAGYVGTTAATYGRAYLNGVDATPASLANATSTTALTSIVATATNTTTTTTPVVTVPGSAQSYTLTAGIDRINGGPGNDTITSTVAGNFGSGDVIDGGAGTDTLTVTSSSTINSTGVTVTNLETASFTSDRAVSLNTTTWTGLTSLTTQSNGFSTTLSVGTGTDVTATALGRGGNPVSVEGGSNISVTASGSTTGAISVGTLNPPTGTVTVSNSTSAAGNMGYINVRGGTTVKVTQIADNDAATTATLGAVLVFGTAGTTTVEVNNTARATASIGTAGVTTNSVTITDVNGGSPTLKGTITHVSVSNSSIVSINGTGLTDLNLKGGSGNIVITNGGLTAPTNRTLNLTLDGQTGGTLTDAGIYTTLNLITSGSNSTLANIADNALATLNISGSQTLTLTSTAGLSALTAVNVSGSAGLAANLTSTTLASIDATSTSGNVTVSIDGTQTRYSGGSGIDKVTLSATPTNVISGGAGTADVLTITAAAAAGLANPALVSGFEEVLLGGSTNQTITTSHFVGATQFKTSGGNGLTLANMVTGNTLQLTGAGTAYTVSGNGFAAGINDTLNLKLTDGSAAGVQFAATGITAANIENIVITVSDTQASPGGAFSDSVTLLGDTSKAITVSGNAGLNLTATSSGLTSVDASGITLGGFSWNSGALTSAAITVKGSTSGTNVIDLSAASTAVVTYTGGSGSNTVTTGNGNDIVTIGNISGATHLNFGSGSDTLVLNGIATTTAAFAQTTGLGYGEIIDFSGAKGGAANSAQTNLGAMLTGQTTLTDYLNAAAASSVTTGASAVLNWFQYGGNTYIVQDTAANSFFTAGFDTVVQLSGTLNLTHSTVSAGVVTLGGPA